MNREETGPCFPTLLAENIHRERNRRSTNFPAKFQTRFRVFGVRKVRMLDPRLTFSLRRSQLRTFHTHYFSVFSTPNKR